MGQEIPVPYYLKGKKPIDNITDGEGQSPYYF